ncbi:nucleotidyltransferase domain-containing protein [Agrobacterium larrymoorei]|uniref:Nucleotidyltransferase domain-containing protein n=1 Tax=Agrobacterium larrymoorei TaxID=160699 RepID=A0A4D7DLM0_9HYPH|nr:nucleotidyltransferase domain-containing protein [Agrobacterium larrymoorei]QCI98433.1 nucleotidyltransferase domain-containing protein [Agrobacterium larrymoorei]QYA06106.1 nucleotidyltransferase domain-containing protein [Agrobacterium larrymoorei]
MSIVAESLGGRVALAGRFPELGPLLARIKEAYNPVDIVLYGSRARDDATAQSDWDLKVIVQDDAPERLFSPLFGWRVQEGSGVYADVSCARLSDFVADLEIANSAASHIADDGMVLDVR